MMPKELDVVGEWCQQTHFEASSFAGETQPIG